MSGYGGCGSGDVQMDNDDAGTGLGSGEEDDDDREEVFWEKTEDRSGGVWKAVSCLYSA